ncbi:MAG: hypothetical protein ACJ76V_00545 [Thermoleophilaceae bacterium]
MRRTLALITATAILAAAGGTAEAAAKKQHSVRMDALITELGAAQSGTITSVGIAKGKPLGAGTVRVDATLNGTKVTGKAEFFTENGAVKGNVTATLTPQADGSTAYKGTGKLTSGTGRFKGASSGTLTITGSQAKGDNIVRLKISGKVKY